MSVVAPPIDVARAMVARGARREAEIVLRGTLARGGHDGDAHFALATLERGGSLPPGPTPRLDLELVDRWIREGLLVEALALLAGIDLGGPAEEWANLLGELLAPVPAHAEDAFVQMHRELTSGGASVALTILEDRERQGALPGWAERRLSLLRWMLLDNAEAAPDDHAPQGMAPTALAAVLRAPLSQRSLEGVLAATEEFARSRPDDADARALVPLVALLVREMTTLLQMDLSGFQTVPVAGRPAAAMQLRMGNLDGAASIYRSLTAKQPGDSMVAQLHDAVRGLLRVLEGRPVIDRSFAPPRDEARAPRVESVIPAAPGVPREVLPGPSGPLDGGPLDGGPLVGGRASGKELEFDDHTENESPDDLREPTRSVPNPLLVFEDTTVVRESGEASIPVTSVSIALPDHDPSEPASEHAPGDPPATPPSADALPLVSRRPTSVPPPAKAARPSDDDARSARHAGAWDPAEVASVAESVRPPPPSAHPSAGSGTHPSEEDDDADSETTALPREKVERILGRPPRPTMPFGSRPPPPPDVPRTETEMQRADDPDPTILAAPTVVVHPIRPIGVRGSGGSGGEEPR